jgi:DNA invertase Pin-like site-specific DNA recombinase
VGRSLKDLVAIAQQMEKRGVGLLALTGARIDLATIVALGEYELNMHAEAAHAVHTSKNGRPWGGGGRKPDMTLEKVLKVQAAICKQRIGDVSLFCAEHGIHRHTLYRYFSPEGELREPALKILKDAGVAP